MSVYKREGHWHFSKTINGVRYRGALTTARNKAQAQQAEAKVILEVHQGEYSGRRNSTTLNDFVDTVFVPWAKANRRSWNKDGARLQAIRRFFGSKRLSDISPFLIERFKTARRNSKIEYGSKSSKTARPRSIASVNRELSLLSRIFSIAIMSKEVRTNPCRDVKPIPGEQPRTRYLLPDQEKRLMEVLSKKPAYLGAIVTLAINTGMRRGEILGLQWDQVDFFREEIKAVKTKNGHDRPVPMNGTVKAVLSSLKETSQNRFLFPSPRKKGNCITDIKKSFTTALEEAGIKNFRFHDLRHTFGTRAADGGVEMTAIAEVMGHADIRTTRRYSHATDQGRRRAVEAVEQHSKNLVTIRSQMAAGA